MERRRAGLYMSGARRRNSWLATSLAGHLVACVVRQSALDYWNDTADNSGNGTKRLALRSGLLFVYIQQLQATVELRTRAAQ